MAGSKGWHTRLIAIATARWCPLANPDTVPQLICTDDADLLNEQ
jgi:hypothetical protein